MWYFRIIFVRFSVDHDDYNDDDDDYNDRVGPL